MQVRREGQDYKHTVSHYVAYHNPQAMAYTAAEVTGFGPLTPAFRPVHITERRSRFNGFPSRLLPPSTGRQRHDDKSR